MFLAVSISYVFRGLASASAAFLLAPTNFSKGLAIASANFFYLFSCSVFGPRSFSYVFRGLLFASPTFYVFSEQISD